MADIKNFVIPDIPASKFRLVQKDADIHDVKFETKPVGFFKDAWRRFCKNKSSVVAAIIIACLLLFAFIGPFITKYEMSEANGTYAKCRPINRALNINGFWDGGYNKKLNDKYLIYIMGIGMGAEDTGGEGCQWSDGIESQYGAIISIGDEYSAEGNTYRDARVDSYMEMGFQYLSLTEDQYNDIKAWEAESGIRAIYPMINIYGEWCDEYNRDDANYWYRHNAKQWPVNEKGKKMEVADVMENGLIDNYLRDGDGNIMDYMQRDSNMRTVRVLYYNYYQYLNGHTPEFLLGADPNGYDILVRIASGLRLSFLLSIAVSLVNFLVGTIYGAIEGYYGGAVDLIGERISDIISGIPFIVSCVLVKLHMVNTGKMSAFGGLVFAYFLTGWIGQAYLVRTQFYRFKNQEYILAARTLGAKDGRLMFKHILPNALGTIVTACALDIPSVILSESTLSFLGIYNFNSRTLTSLGTMLGDGQGYLSTYPHIILFPALAISLLMISFNLFGNGLRDAFNPTLRGGED